MEQLANASEFVPSAMAMSSSYQILSIWLGIQFWQRNVQIKDKKPKKKFRNIFGWDLLGDRRGTGTYSKFVQRPFIIDLRMEECQI